MNCIEIKEGEVYTYKMPYKEWEQWKCIKIYFNESQNQWCGQFELLTDPYKCNRIGHIQSFNQIEMERYIHS